MFEHLSGKQFVDRYVLGSGWSQYPWWGPECSQDELGLFLQVVDDEGDEMEESGHVENDALYDAFKHLMVSGDVPGFNALVEMRSDWRVGDVDADANDIDIVLQWALFGEVVFG